MAKLAVTPPVVGSVRRRYRDAGVVELREGGGDFGHLHEAYDALHHARAAGCGDDDEGLARDAGAIGGAGDGFAHHSAHGAADEGVFHGADDDRMRAQPADGVEDGVVEAGLLLRGAQPLLIGLDVDEVREGRWSAGRRPPARSRARAAVRCAARAPILKWCWHFGQTLRLARRSALKIAWRQPGHLIQRPSVRTFFSS